MKFVIELPDSAVKTVMEREDVEEVIACDMLLKQAFYRDFYYHRELVVISKEE